MVLTAGQTTAFFEDNDQMGIPNATRVQMQAEGITTPDDLVDFHKDELRQLAENLRKPPGRIQNPDPGAAAGATIPTPGFTFGAMSQMKLLVAANAVRYYDTTGRPLTAANMIWNPVLRNFKQQWEALQARRDQDIEVPRLTSTLGIIKWTEAMVVFYDGKVGIRFIPLAYVIRESVAVPGAAPALENSMPHLTQHGSVEKELIARALHTHPLFAEDNKEVFNSLEEGLCGTIYAASLKPFERAKNGRGAWLAITSQFAGQDKWEAMWKKCNEYLVNMTWTGAGSFTLERFCAAHREKFITMQQCATHLPNQVPDQRTRVTYLIDNIKCADAELQAALSRVKTDTGEL